MTPADGIRKLGFRRWHERQLIESHVYLVTGFLSMILMLACFETFSFRAPGVEPILTLVLMGGGAALCFVSLRRYLTLLCRAMQVGEQSVCGSCGSSGRLQVTGSGLLVNAPEAESLGVQCRDCGHQWTVSYH